MDRADLAFRAAAAHHCQPAAAGRFWAIYGLLTPSERSTYTGRPGIRGQLQRPLRETTEAAAARYQALLADLLSWAKVQSTTSATSPPPASSSDWRPATPNRRRRRGGGGATAAAARAGGEAPSAAPAPSSDDEGPAEETPAPASAAAAAASPRGPRPPAIYHYTGDRARDATETERRRSRGLCLKCLPGGTINSCPCPLHPANALESSAPRCFPYRD